MKLNRVIIILPRKILRIAEHFVRQNNQPIFLLNLDAIS